MICAVKIILILRQRKHDFQLQMQCKRSAAWKAKQLMQFYTWAVSDVIVSKIVTPAMLEVHNVVIL